MIPLPINDALPSLLAALRQHPNAVLVAPPGAGKTTRVPPALLHAGLLDTPSHGSVVMLQPRRVAARAAAVRIADEQGWELGQQVGYQVRFEKRMTDRTRIRVVTEGILTRQLQDDPELAGVACVILDEFHERSLHTDLALALLREVQQTLRPDLKLIVMSATLAAEPVAAFLGDAAPAPIVRSEGRLFPVEVLHRPNEDARLLDRVTAAIQTAAPDSPGDLLVFLPGAEEIRRIAERLDPLAARGFAIVPLHGTLTFEDQKRALDPAPAGTRKIILATNIAETSLTIEGVRTVIDSGLARIASFDPTRGLDRLDLAPISKASIAQRAGRAGRTGPGACIRLYSAAHERALPDFDLPEIARVDLASTVLSLHAWGIADPRTFGWFQPPPEDALAHAEELLAMLGAIAGGRITPIGRRTLALPVHPRIARLLIAAEDSRNPALLHAAAAIGAILAERDFLKPAAPGSIAGPRTVARSDVLVRLQLLADIERTRFAAYWRDQGVDLSAARQILRARDELARLLNAPRHADLAALDETALLQLPLWAYPDRVARRRSPGSPAAIAVGGSGMKLAPESAVVHDEFFIAIDARHDARAANREALVRIASGIDPAWLHAMFPHDIRTENTVAFDADRGRVHPLHRTLYHDLPLKEDRHGSLDPTQAAAALAAAVRPQARDWFERDEAAANMLARIHLARTTMPEHPWPDLTDDALADILAEACPGKRSLDDLRSANLAQLLRAHLPYPLDRTLDTHVPETIAVPTGNRIRLDYTPARRGDPPVLAVRLQEMFGQLDTPRICNGRVKVLLHLLGPNYRPVQITDDLASFWKSAYFEVRKDLRTRYPKHAWPEDPLTAPPQAKGRPRK